MRFYVRKKVKALMAAADLDFPSETLPTRQSVSRYGLCTHLRVLPQGHFVCWCLLRNPLSTSGWEII